MPVDLNIQNNESALFIMRDVKSSSLLFSVSLQHLIQRPITASEQIHDNIQQQLSLCTCPHQFPVQKVADGKYKVCCRLLLPLAVDDDSVFFLLSDQTVR